MAKWKRVLTEEQRLISSEGTDNMKFNPNKQHRICFAFIQLAAEIWQKTFENILTIPDTCRKTNILFTTAISSRNINVSGCSQVHATPCITSCCIMHKFLMLCQIWEHQSWNSSKKICVQLQGLRGKKHWSNHFKRKCVIKKSLIYQAFLLISSAKPN